MEYKRSRFSSNEIARQVLVLWIRFQQFQRFNRTQKQSGIERPLSKPHRYMVRPTDMIAFQTDLNEGNRVIRLTRVGHIRL